jgi:hypothetical protein
MWMTPTRTPEGEPAHCRVCGHEALVMPSTFPTTDAPCPACGSLQWLTGDPAREEGGQIPVQEVVAEMEAAIQRGAERLKELQRRTEAAREAAASQGGATKGR